MPITTQDFPFYRAVAAFESKNWQAAIGDFIQVAEQNNLAALHYLNHYHTTSEIWATLTPEYQAQITTLTVNITILPTDLTTDRWFKTSLFKMNWDRENTSPLEKKTKMKWLCEAARTCANARVFLENLPDEVVKGNQDQIKNIAKNLLCDVYMALNYNEKYYQMPEHRIVKTTYEVLKRKIEQYQSLISTSGALEEKLYECEKNENNKLKFFENACLFGAKELQYRQATNIPEIEDKIKWMIVVMPQLTKEQKWDLYKRFDRMPEKNTKPYGLKLLASLLPENVQEVSDDEVGETKALLVKACLLKGRLSNDDQWLKKSTELGCVFGFYYLVRKITERTEENVEKRWRYLKSAYAMDPKETLKFIVQNGSFLLRTINASEGFLTDLFVAGIYENGFVFLDIKKDLMKAIEANKEIIEKYPKESKEKALHNHIGYLYNKQYDFFDRNNAHLDEAIVWFERAIERKESEYWQAYYNKARALIAKGERYSEDCIGSLFKAKQRIPAVILRIL